MINLFPHLVGVWEQSFSYALEAEAEDARVFLADPYFLLEGVAERELVLELGWRQGVRSTGLDAG